MGYLLSSMGSHGPKALVSCVHHVASWGGDLGPVKGWRQAWGGPLSAGRSPEPGQGNRDKVSCGNGSGGGQSCVLGPEGTVGPIYLPLPSSGLRNGTRPLSPARQAGPMGWGTARRHPPRASTPPLRRPPHLPQTDWLSPAPRPSILTPTSQAWHLPLHGCLQFGCAPTQAGTHTGVRVQTHFTWPRAIPS